MTLLDRLRGGLIVSVQARAGSALDDPRVLSAMALAADRNGAVAVRIEGARNIEAVRARVEIPVVGIVKREYAGFEPYITPTVREVREILDAGAAIVAFDATRRKRPDGTGDRDLIEAIHAGGALAMADCARPEDGPAVAAAGADIVATTLCGYTKETRGAVLPALDLVAAFVRLPALVVCEGGVHTPDQAAGARRAGADAVVVGTAITNTEWLVRSFAQALARARDGLK